MRIMKKLYILQHKRHKSDEMVTKAKVATKEVRTESITLRRVVNFLDKCLWNKN